MNSVIEMPSLDPSLDPKIIPEAVQRQASDPTTSVWVGASAGTGKTKVLTDRVLRLLLAGTPPGRLLCLTFTKAAAAEMSNRLNTTLGGWAILPEADLNHELTRLLGQRPSDKILRQARRLFAQVLECAGGMKIQTIHAFAQSLLARFPLEAGVHPHFKVLDERTADDLLERAIHQLLMDAPYTASADHLKESIDQLALELSEQGFRKILRKLVSERGRLQYALQFFKGKEAVIKAIYQNLGVLVGETSEQILQKNCQDTSFRKDQLFRAAEALLSGSVNDQKRGRFLKDWLNAPCEQRLFLFDDYKGIFLTKENEPLKTLATKEVLEKNPQIKDILGIEAQRLINIQENIKKTYIAKISSSLISVAYALLDIYDSLKAPQGALDFNDIILTARNLLSQPGIAPWILYKLDGGLDHILLDEAQDTNPEQWHIIQALTEEFFAGLGIDKGNRTLFVVGDEKQSIFSFQGADVAAFTQMRSYFTQRTIEAQKKWRKIDLEISFRSTSAVLQAVNGVFALPEAKSGVVGPESIVHHKVARKGQAGLVEIWPLSVQEESGPLAIWPLPIVQKTQANPSVRLANEIAETIRHWLNTGEKLPSRDRAIRPGDIMILVRQRSAFFEHMVRALKVRNIPVSGIDRMVLTKQLPVMDLVALGQFLLLPEDDLTLATILKSPLIGLTEEDLFVLAYGRPGTLWQSLCQKSEENTFFQQIKDWLSTLLAEVDFVPPFTLYERILSHPCPGDTISGRRAMLTRLGLEAQDALDEFLSQALIYGYQNAVSLQGFLHWFNSSETEIKREMHSAKEEELGQVRLLTTHGAKGLEAPIVFLPDTTGLPPQHQDLVWMQINPDISLPLCTPTQEKDCQITRELKAETYKKQEEEYRRLLYVALTRAEDRLYIAGWTNKRGLGKNSWYDLVTRGLQDFGESWTLPAQIENPTAWQGVGRRFVDIQTSPLKTSKYAEKSSVTDYPIPNWARQAAKKEILTRPVTPSHLIASEPALVSPLQDQDQQPALQRGILIHRLMQILPDVEIQQRENVARKFLALPGYNLSPKSQKEIITQVMAILNDPQFSNLFSPGSLAEVPVVGKKQGQPLSARIDRLRVTETEIWIVDYKSQRLPPVRVQDTPSIYLAQMAIYRQAIQQIWPQRLVKSFLLWTEIPQLMELPDSLLKKFT